MSWFKCDPTDFWNQHEVQALTIDAAGLLWWLCGRSWTTGPIRDDPAFYRRMAFSRLRDFDSSWKEVRSVLEVRDGHLVFPWFERQREDSMKRLKSDRVRKELARGVIPAESAGFQQSLSASADNKTRQDKTRQDKNLLTPLRGEAPAEPVVWPKELQTPEFQATWDEFVQYRKERRLSAYKPTGLKRLIGEMMEVGHDQAILGLRKTISKNWQGPHFEKPKTSGYAPATRVGSADYLPEIDQ